MRALGFRLPFRDQLEVAIVVREDRPAVGTRSFELLTIRLSQRTGISRTDRIVAGDAHQFGELRIDVLVEIQPNLQETAAAWPASGS